MSQLTVAVTSRDHQQGSPRAPVTLVEYGDYECPYCGEAYYVVNKLIEDLGKTLRFVFRNFPLSQIHPHAEQAACASETAGLQGKFWDMHDVLFEHQDALDEHHLVGYAYLIELDIAQFVSDMASETVLQKVQSDFWSGIRSGVNGTPTFFVNGRRHEGAYSYGELRAAIELSAKQKAKA